MSLLPREFFTGAEAKRSFAQSSFAYFSFKKSRSGEGRRRLLRGFGDGLHAKAAAQAAGVIDGAELQTGAQGIHHIHQPGLHGPGQLSAQRPHMGEDNIPLLVAQVGELLGIAGGGPGMVKALPAGVGRLISGVIEVQVVQESAWRQRSRPGPKPGQRGTTSKPQTGSGPGW